MDVADYLLGSAALLIGLLPWIPASRRLARRLVPDVGAAESALVAAVVATGSVIVVAEVLGVCNGLRRWPFAVVSAVVALVVSRFGRPREGAVAARRRLPRDRTGWMVWACVAVCVVATSATLLGRDAAVVRTGPLDLDSLHYHLTQAAQMVHTHDLDSLHHTASSDGTLYYPFDTELLAAIAMLGPHPDLAVFGLNLLFGWLALLACWVIGVRWSSRAGPAKRGTPPEGAAALAAGAAVLALPIVSRASTGPGLNDIPTMAFVLSAVGCLAIAGVPRGEQTRGRWLAALSVVGAAMGLAAGSKLNALPLVVLIAVGVVVLARGNRLAVALVLSGGALLTGGFWYVRDWILVGSPLPDLNLTIAGHGFHVVPYPEVKPYAFNVAHYLGDGSVIRHWFVPGLRAVWTDLWPLVGVLMVLGVILGLVEWSWPRRVVSAAVVVGFVAYIVTPTTAIGAPGAPVLFATNTRYALPVMVVAMMLLATSSSLRRFTPVLAMGFTALTVALLALEALPQQVDYLIGVPVMLGVLVVAAACAWLRGRARWYEALVASAAVVAVVVGGGAVVQRHYEHTRYAAGDAQARLFRGLGSLHDTRIGVAGHGLEYPFYGHDFSNEVNYIGVSAPSKAFDGPTSCPALLTVLRAQHDDFVVVESLPIEHTDRLARWIAAIPGVVEVFDAAADRVFKLPATIPTNACA